MPDVDALKAEISREWLGVGGVRTVGVGEDAGLAVVVVTLEGGPGETLERLRARYDGLPVRFHTGEGVIRPL